MSARGWTGFFASMCVVLAASTAWAADRLVVVLRDGNVVSGELVESVDGDHVTVRQADGIELRIPWARVLSKNVIDPREAAPPGAAPGAGIPMRSFRIEMPKPPEPYEGSDGIRVTLDTPEYDSAPHLEMALGSEQSPTFKPLCNAPCGVMLDPRGRYRISGGVFETSDKYGNLSANSMADSALFSLPADGPNQTLHVRGRMTVTRYFGWVFLPLGTAFGGVAIAAAAGAFDTQFDAMTPKDKTLRYALGLPFGAIGATFIPLGLYFVLRPLTTVTDQRGNRIASDTVKLGGGFELGPKGLVF